MINENNLTKNELDRYEKMIKNYENIETSILNKEIIYLNNIYHNLIKICVEKKEFNEISNILLDKFSSLWNGKNLTDFFGRKKDLKKVLYLGEEFQEEFKIIGKEKN